MNVRSSKEHYLRVVLFSGAFREWNIAFKYSSSEMCYIVIHNNLHFGIPLIVNGSLPLWVAGFRASFFIICSGTITSAKPPYQLLCRDICHSKKRGNSAVSILVCSLVTKLCLTLCNPINCSPPGSSVHGIFRQEKWVATSSSRGPSWLRDPAYVSYTAGGFFTTEPPGKPPILVGLFCLSVKYRSRCNLLDVIWKRQEEHASGRRRSAQVPSAAVKGVITAHSHMSWLISSLFALTPTCLFRENEITPLKTLGKVFFFFFFFLNFVGKECYAIVKGNNEKTIRLPTGAAGAGDSFSSHVSGSGWAPPPFPSKKPDLV